MKMKKYLSSAIAASLALVEAMPVLAEIEEVKVTARKREESVLQVPVTMTAISQSTLEQNNVVDIKGVANMTPGLNFSNGPLASGVMVSLRGVGSGSSNPMIDQSVALVADGMQFTQGLAFGSAMFDMAQVEILKGPQALFFGKAAPAGVINIRTADPTSEPKLTVTAGYEFEAEEKVGELIASGPATDTLGLRLAAKWSEMEGYFQNDAQPMAISPLFLMGNSSDLGAAPVTHKDFPEQQSVLVRGTALWQPTESFTARLKLNYSEMDTQGTGGEPYIVSCPGGTAPNPLLTAFGLPGFIGGIDCKAGKHVSFVYMDPEAFPGIYNDGVPFMKYRQTYGSLELNYDLGNELTLTSVTGLYGLDQKSLFNLGLTTQLGSPFGNQGHMQRDDFTQELRLRSDYSGAINYVLGAFYQNGETDYISRLPGNQDWQPLMSIVGVTVPKAYGYNSNKMESEAISLFGQVQWELTDELELAVGTRWTHEERRDHVKDLSPTLDGLPADEADLTQPKLLAINYSPEATLTYTPSPELTLYGSIKQAYKSGSFDIAGGDEDGRNLAYKDERVRAAELGLKSRLFDNEVAINTAAYYYKYTDMQVESMVFNPLAGVASIRTTNAGSSHIYGIDFDITYAPSKIDGLTLFAAANWNKAKYDDFKNGQCWAGQSIAQGCNLNWVPDDSSHGPTIPAHYTGQDLSGTPLLRSPEWIANAGFSYDIALGDEVTLRLGSNASFSSSYSASVTNIHDGYQSAYIKTNASIGLIGAEERWKVELIGNNLTDKYTYGNCSPQDWKDSLIMGELFAGTGTANGSAPSMACFVDRGRTVTLRLTTSLQ